LEADAAVIRMEDERGDQLVFKAIHVADPRLEEPLRPLMTREQSVEKLPGRRLFRMRRPLVLDSRSARRLGSSYELLVPFLEQGSTAVVVPIATPTELLATLTVVSLDPEHRIGPDAADTALAKFAFRSLVRLYPDPGELLAQVNEVALGELAGGNFVTMLCVTVDPVTGAVSAASAGHPPARVLASDGTVAALASRGLALGIEAGQRYEKLATTLPPGAALCLYTDGLVEARREAALYGEERLEAAL